MPAHALIAAGTGQVWAEAIRRDNAKRRAIVRLESTLRDLTAARILPEPDCPLEHVFAPGAYGRQIFIPKDSLIVGKIHKHAHLNFLMQGTVTVATEEGPVRLTAPLMMVSKAGTKRVVYTHEDTIWATVHLTDSTDLDEIEEQIIAKTYEEFDAIQDQDVIQLLPLVRLKEEV